MTYRYCALTIAVLIFQLALLGCVTTTVQAEDDERPPNVILVLVDDMGWTDLTCMGSEYFETPNIDRLADEGLRFTDGYAACAVCSPTRAAVLTGRYPARTGVTDWIRARFQGGNVPPPGTEVSEYVGGSGKRLLTPRNPLYMESEEFTLAEALAPAGYTSCHIGKWHLGPDDWYPERQGFDFNFGGCDMGQPLNYFDPYTAARLPDGIPTLAARREGEYLTDREADEAVNFIREHRDVPFFLYLAHYAVHTPIQAKPDVVAEYEEKPKTNQNNATYAAMVESVDDAMGRVLETLDELELTENTLVIFTSDNGGLLGPTNNAPLRSGKGFPWEGGIRVPVIVRWPGVTSPGTTTAVPVTSVDYFPTILAAADVALPDDRAIDGVDLRSVLEGASQLDRESLYWHFPHYRGRRGPYSIIRSGDWKLIRWYQDEPLELYNLADDLSESHNLAEEMPDRASELEGQLMQWLEEAGAKLPREKTDAQGN